MRSSVKEQGTPENTDAEILEKTFMAGSTHRKTSGINAVSAPPSPREIMDIRQAAEYLGISSDSLYKYASESVIPAFKLGNRWRFKRSLLESWIEQQSTLTPVLTQERSVKPKQKKPVSRAR